MGLRKRGGKTAQTYGNEMKNRYTIGDMSSICNISRKALRYYEEIELISSTRNDFNNYRYYTDDALLAIPVIKYYKQMGFTLEEMRVFIDGNDGNMYRAIRTSFLSKIKALEKEQEEIQRKHRSVKDWYDLIVEAEMVIDNNIHEVSIKYIESSEYIYKEQVFDNDIRAAIINIDFTNYVEELANEVSGPVILNFSSFKSRMQGESQPIRILQKTLLPCMEEMTMNLGGCMMATCYHIGSHEDIHATYEMICNWVSRHGYVLDEESYERYVADYWTTKNTAQFVTEVMVRVFRRA